MKTPSRQLGRPLASMTNLYEGPFNEQKRSLGRAITPANRRYSVRLWMDGPRIEVHQLILENHS